MHIKIDTVFNGIKGRLGEAVAARILMGLGWEVHRTGIEFSAPLLAGAVRSDKIFAKATAVKPLRDLPDFLAHRGDQSLLVECKYRTNGTPDRSDIRRYEKFGEDVVVLLLTPKGAYAALLADLLDKGDSAYCSLADFEVLVRPDDVEIAREFEALCIGLFPCLPENGELKAHIAASCPN